ncbi:MAG: ABC transporter permease subunit [Proteobacteria bacterium]|nr:ABC transporter permease subunit [Pseudomonadota bacterium]
MIAYLIKRLLLIIPTFIGMTMILFALTRFVPGGPMEKLLMQQFMEGGSETGSGSMGGAASDRAGGALSDEQLDALKARFGLDKPWYVAYFYWLWDFVNLDFGESTRYYDSVWGMLVERLPVSAYYGFFTFLIMYLVSIPLGIFKSLVHNSWFDTLSSMAIFLGFAVPGYVVAVVLLVYPASRWEWFPLGGFISDDISEMSKWQVVKDVVDHSILPMIAYLLGGFAMLTYHMKSLLMEQLSMDYVRTAVAKGVPYRQAVLKHAIRNAIIPLASGFGGLLTVFFGGSYLIEKVFNIDGLGLLAFESALERDYPVLIGVFAITGVLLLMGQIVADFAVAVIDPRVRFD